MSMDGNVKQTEMASDQVTSAPTTSGQSPGAALDPALIFNKDVATMSINEQIVHIIQQNKCNFIMNNKLDDKVEKNLESIRAQEETIQVLKMNQQCIAQHVMEIKNQFVNTHTYIDNKVDEILKDTQESLREDRNVLLWQLEKKELNAFKKDSSSDAETVEKFAFKIVKEKLPYIEPIDIRAVTVPARPGDKPEHFRMIIKFVSPGDANKFRVRLNADGTITLRKGMSLMTRNLCTKYKDLARMKNEAEPEGSNFEYRTKYQFSIVRHTKGNPDDIHGIAHSLNPSDPYSKIKLRKGMDLVPFPGSEEVPMEASESEVAIVAEVPGNQDAQDLGAVETPFHPPGESNAIGDSLATPVGRKRGRSVDDDEEFRNDSATKNQKKHRDNSREIIPRGGRHGPPPRFQGPPPPSGGFRSNFRGGNDDYDFDNHHSYRNGNSYRRNNGHFRDQRRRDNHNFNGGFFRDSRNNYRGGFPGGHHQNWRRPGFDSGYDYDQGYSSNYYPIGQRRGNGKTRGRPRGSSKRGRGANSNIDSNSNANSNANLGSAPQSSASNTSSSSKSSDTILSQDQINLADSVPVNFDSFDGKYISRFLQSHKKPHLAMKITQQKEELLKKGQALQDMERRNLDLQRRLQELEAGTGSSGSSSSSSNGASSSVASKTS